MRCVQWARSYLRVRMHGHPAATVTAMATNLTNVLCVVVEVLLDAQILPHAIMTARRVATTLLARTSQMEIAIVKAISSTPLACVAVLVRPTLTWTASATTWTNVWAS